MLDQFKHWYIDQVVLACLIRSNIGTLIRWCYYADQVKHWYIDQVVLACLIRSNIGTLIRWCYHADQVVLTC
jgi:hypothetical protein